MAPVPNFCFLNVFACDGICFVTVSKCNFLLCWKFKVYKHEEYSARDLSIDFLSSVILKLISSVGR